MHQEVGGGSHGGSSVVGTARRVDSFKEELGVMWQSTSKFDAMWSPLDVAILLLATNFSILGEAILFTNYRVASPSAYSGTNKHQ